MPGRNEVRSSSSGNIDKRVDEADILHPQEGNIHSDDLSLSVLMERAQSEGGEVLREDELLASSQMDVSLSRKGDPRRRRRRRRRDRRRRTPAPTPRPTPKPTAKPTPKPTPKPTTKATGKGKGKGKGGKGTTVAKKTEAKKGSTSCR